MQKTCVETQGKAEAVSQELKSLKIQEVELTDAIEASINALSSAKDQIERVCEMIAKANLLLSLAKPLRVVTTQLEQLTTESNQVHQLEAEKEAALSGIQSRLA